MSEDLFIEMEFTFSVCKGSDMVNNDDRKRG